MRAPRTPSQSARELREATHLPLADWCEYCVRGRSRNKPHKCRNKKAPSRVSDEVAELPWEGQASAASKDESEAPKVSLDYFFLGSDQIKRITRNSADKMTSKQLKQKLRIAGLPVKGNREELVARYDKFIRDTLAEEGMSSPSEGDDIEDRAADNPAVVMTDESTGNKYMRLVDSKGLKEGHADPWLIKDLHAELKAWGRPGGGDNRLIIKSDGESPIVAVREALARKHGGIISPEQPPKG